MKIISCIKHVHNLELILEQDWIVNNNKVDVSYANKIINPYDEAALELMLKIKDIHKAKTKAITIGNNKADDILRKALAIGVEEVERIDSNKEESLNNTVELLYNSIKKDNPSLVLCGKQSDNKNHGQTGQKLAAKLDWPCFANVFDITINNNQAIIFQKTKKGILEITTNLPIVVTTIQSDNSFLRLATLRNSIEARKKEIIVTENSNIAEIKETKQLTTIKSNKECKYITSNKELENLINSLTLGGELL